MQKLEPRRRTRAQSLFREVNKRIRRLLHATGSDRPSLFLCECEDAACGQTVELTLEEFEAIRWRENVYIVAVGHERAGEAVVEEMPGFVLVKRSAESP